MEVLIFFALVIIIILLLNIKSRQKEVAARTHQSFLSLKKELLELKEAAENTAPKATQPLPTDETVVQWRPHTPQEILTPFKERTSEEPTPIPDAIESPVPTVIPVADEGQSAAQPSAVPQQQVQPQPTESWWNNWLRNNPDLEKFIGENLINKIGITILVLGIAFFVKYAIDQNWIRESGRVTIGIGCGVILTGLAHYLRNSYRSFSSVLAGGGIAVFYFTIAFAFHQYQLFSQTSAFVIMVLITAFAVLLSLLYNKLELAVIAAIGGFITPFLVSTGSGNYIVLFSYLLILNIGMLVLAYFKKWQAINVIAFFFTLIIYGGWLAKTIFSGSDFPMYKNSMLFCTAFYLLFLVMGMIYNIRTQRPFKAFDFSLLMVTTFSYYTAGMINLHYWDQGAWQGLFTIALGLINFCLAWYFYKTGKGDKNLLYLLIGLTLTFVSLAAPVQLHGHTITLFWSAEFVLLYWLHQRSGIRVFKYSSFIIVLLMLISLLMDWLHANDAGTNRLVIIYNNLQGLATNIVAVAAFAIYSMLLRKEQNTTNYIGVKNSAAAISMVLASAIIFYLTCLFGVNLFFSNSQSLDIPNSWHQLITYLFAILFLWLIKRIGLQVGILLQVLTVAGCLLFYFLSIPSSIGLRNGVLQNQYPTVQLWVHWFAVILLLYLVYQAIRLYRNNITAFSRNAKTFIWLVNIVLIIFFSVECMHAYIFGTSSMQNSDTSLQQYSKAGLTIVWALCSFAIMWLGMRHKYKTLRIISLCLLSAALLKLFLFDIRNISAGGKIAAFIMLGVLLLIISFMYQKLKKIIIDDTTQ